MKKMLLLITFLLQGLTFAADPYLIAKTYDETLKSWSRGSCTCVLVETIEAGSSGYYGYPPQDINIYELYKNDSKPWELLDKEYNRCPLFFPPFCDK